MKILSLSALLAASLTMASCGTVSRMFQAGGRALHLGSADTQPPDHPGMDSREVHEVLADGARVDVKPEESRPELAQR